MQYKRAGIRSKEAAASRLKAGEVFYYGTENWCIMYDHTYMYTSTSPYRCGEEPIASETWDNHENWKSKTEWFDNIPKKGTLCWVGSSENKVNEHEELDIITNWPYTDSHPFESRENAYACATPVQGADLNVILHERQAT